MKRLLAAAVIFSVAGCAVLMPPSERADAIAREGGFARQDHTAAGFHLRIYSRMAQAGAGLTVYLEGDGAPWPRMDLPPRDPTPHDPTSLRLAAADPAQNVAWIARPCQYLNTKELVACDQRYWTMARYGEDVLRAVAAAIDHLVRQGGAPGVTLAGYSGGGALATLIAARRSDVKLLITVAAPLDTAAWTALHRLTPLAQSENPASHAGLLSQVPQVHYAGERDTVVPPVLAESFSRRVGARARVVRVGGFDHDCCWVRDWRMLLNQARQ